MKAMLDRRQHTITS